MSVKPYKDFGKKANDLLNKEFDEGQNKVLWKTKPTSQFSVETEVVQKGKSSVGTIKPKFVDKERGLTFNLDTNTKFEGSAKVEIPDKLLPGLQTDIAFNRKAAGEGFERYITFTGDYKGELLRSNVEVDLLKSAGEFIRFSASTGADGYGIGVNTEYKRSHDALAEFTKLEIAGTKSAKNYEVTASFKVNTTDNGTDQEKVGLSFSHDVNDDISGAFIFEHDLNQKGSSKLLVGGKYVYDKDSTIKAKLDAPSMDVGAALKTELTKNTTFNLGTKFNLTKSTEPKVGFSLTFNL
eukprot:TRINITY_DN31375_c0_g1_i1.p1 TRINITY_DN31375_c0_g1~~TRINITY_DN31375_c0_g1_i1.p1  ORF type:complete len:295 (+),score=54.52 TRINITY_DN31375_c0_g1_i1:103-987(+)